MFHVHHRRLSQKKKKKKGVLDGDIMTINVPEVEVGPTPSSLLSLLHQCSSDTQPSSGVN